jgi:hypothetical protein
MVKEIGIAAVLALGLVAGLGCESTGGKGDKMSDTKMSADRSGDKVIVTGARGQVATYTWDKKASKAVASADAGECASCKAAVNGYFATGAMPPEACPSCKSKIAVVRGGHSGSGGM